MRLGDTHVKEPVRPLLLEQVRPRTRRHGRRDRHQLGVFRRQLGDRGAKDLRPTRRRGLARPHLSGHGIVRVAGVKLLEVGRIRRKSLALLRDDVDDARPVQLSYEPERPVHGVDVVPVDRTEVPEPELLEQHPR